MTRREEPSADLANMLAALGDDRETLAGLVEHFLRSAPPLLVELRRAIQARDAPQVARVAHRLRGSTAQFSPGAAARALEALEWMGDAADLGGAAAALRQAENGLTQLIVAMRPYRSRTRHRT